MVIIMVKALFGEMITREQECCLTIGVSICSEEPVILHNMPDIRDVQTA